MYCSFYGIPEKPFNITPDPKFLFFGSTHKEAFAHLIYGIRERGGFVAITGEIGTGKTTLCRAILEYMDKDTLVAFIFNPTLSALELLRTINEDFGIPSRGSTKKELIDELNQFLLVKRAEGKNTILIIDEAQNLDPEVLEHIRLLSNLETNTEKLLQIILIGQPELRQVLEQSSLRQLNQRITVRYHLNPLSRKECVEYIQHRLSVVGAEGKVVFDKGAIKRIYRYSKGIPRLINVLCDRALLAGYTQGHKQLSGRIIERAREEVFGGKETIHIIRPERRFRKVIYSGTAFIFLVFLSVYAGSFLVHHNFSAMRTDEKGTTAESVAPASPSTEQVPTLPPATVTGQDSSSGQLSTAGPQPTIPPTPSTDASLPTAPPDSPPSTNDPAALKNVFQKAFEQRELLETRKASLAALINRWTNVPPDKIALSGKDALDVYEASDAFGLSCTYITGSINLLKTLNLPAILSLNFGGAVGKRYVCLLSIEGDEGRIAPPLDNGTDRVPLSILTDFWYGNAYVFWKDFRMKGRLLVKGTHGDEVKWLQGSLRGLGYQIKEISGKFDAATGVAVQSFQKDHYLEEDGVLGPQTKMVLYRSLSGFPMPALNSPVAKDTEARGAGKGN